MSLIRISLVHLVPGSFVVENIELDFPRQSDLLSDRCGLSKITFLGLDYSATIWLIGVTFLGSACI